MRILIGLFLTLVATGCDHRASLSRRLGSPDADVRRKAIYAIEKMGKAGAGFVPALVDAMQDPDVYVRFAAVDALGSLGSAGVSSPLAFSALKDAVRDAAPSMRKMSLSNLRFFATAEEILPVLRETMGDADAKVRAQALYVLSQFLEEIGGQALPLLARALGDSDAEVRHSAALHLGTLGQLRRTKGLQLDVKAEAGAIQALVESLNDDDIHVRSTSESALFWMGLPALPALCGALRDNRVMVRRYAAKALSSICSEAFSDRGFAKRIIPLVLEALLQGAVDDEPIVREACAEALAYLSPDDARAEKATEALLRDRDKGVRNVTRRALREMGRLPGWAETLPEDDEEDGDK